MYLDMNAKDVREIIRALARTSGNLVWDAYIQSLIANLERQLDEQGCT
jgi:hypothetical protein